MFLTEILRDYMWLITLVYGAVLFACGCAGLLISSNVVGNGIDVFHELLGESTKTLIKFKSNLSNLYSKYYYEMENKEYDVDVIGQQLILIMILLSVLFIMTALVGCFIRHNSSSGCVILYLVYVIAIALSVVIAFIVRSTLIEIDMEDSLGRYQGFTDNSKSGVSWSGLMLHLQCCGIRGSDDFKTSKTWLPVKGNPIDINTLRDGLGITSLKGKVIRKEMGEFWCPVPTDPAVDPNYILCDWASPDKFAFPLACCKSADLIKYGCNLNGRANTANSNMDIGCLDKVNEFIDNHESNVLTICIVVISVLASYIIILILRVVLVADEELVEFDPFINKLSNLVPGGDDRGSRISTMSRSSQRRSQSRRSQQTRESSRMMDYQPFPWSQGGPTESITASQGPPPSVPFNPEMDSLGPLPPDVDPNASNMGSNGSSNKNGKG